MAKVLMVIGFAVLAVVTSVIGACEIKAHHYNAAFSHVAFGDSEVSVVARMGVPDVRENSSSKLRIPVHAGHQFRSMPGHDSGPCRATIPVDAGRGV